MLDNAKRFAVMCQRAGVPMRPKMHLLMHVALRALVEGNPSMHVTWQDETLNRLVASIGAGAHRRVWGLRVLERFGHSMDMRAGVWKRKRDE